MKMPLRPLDTGTRVDSHLGKGQVVGRTDYGGIIMYHIVTDKGRIYEDVHIGDLEYAHD